MPLMGLVQAALPIRWQKLEDSDPTVLQTAQVAGHHMVQARALRDLFGEARAPGP
jgi:hypothetical protein